MIRTIQLYMLPSIDLPKFENNTAKAMIWFDNNCARGKEIHRHRNNEKVLE